MRLLESTPERSVVMVPVPAATVDAHRVPPLGHREAASIAAVELDRFLALLRELSPQDWPAPTICRLWDVRQIVAHVAGAAASYAQWREFARQWNPAVQRAHRQPGFSILDALNQIQVADRDTASPEALIAELEDVGPRAIDTRRRFPHWLRSTRLPMPALGVAPIGYLTDLIYTRDMWIHRLDICRATGRPMVLDDSHDGRIVALMVRDLDRRLRPLLHAQALLNLTGSAGGVYLLGYGRAPRSAIRLDALDFAWLATGRWSVEEARLTVAMGGDTVLADRILGNALVPV